MRFVTIKTPAAKLPDAPSNTPSAHPVASVGDQCHPGSFRGVWHRGSGRRNGVDQQLSVVADGNDKRLPEVARAYWAALGVQLRVLKAQILEFDRMINTWHRSNETSKRLDKARGIGPVLATALVATVADPKTFRLGRIYRLGSGWCRSSIRAAARTGSAVSPSKVTDICAACSWPVRWPSFATPRSMAQNIGHGSRRCWRGGRPRLQLSRSPTRSREWSGL
jgi:hypothetical protein